MAAAMGATAWRWGSASLEAIAGAQAVLGPAGWVGPAAAVVAGPAPGGDVWARVLAALVGAGIAYGSSLQRAVRPQARLPAEAVTMVSAALAVGLATASIAVVAQMGWVAMEQRRG